MQKKYQDSEREKLLFYEIMNYPVPNGKEYFFCSDEKEIDIPKKQETISRREISPLMDEYLKYIQKWDRIFKSLPFIKTIYLCNSISFNKINENSDIDIFIVSSKKALRRTRFWSTVVFRIIWIKRSMIHKKKKFCLSFYITEDKQNLYNISLTNTDVYLAYRIAHLIPIYEEEKGNASIYKHNTRINWILPNFRGEQQIFLNIRCTYGKTKIRCFLEQIQKWLRGQAIERIIKTIWLPLIIYKTKKLGAQWKDIIVNNSMLKFHADKRKKIALLYKIARYKTNREKNYR